MGSFEDEEYELGVRNGQRGGAADDFCQSLADTGSPYDKGYAFGADNRRDSSGERYHNWEGTGKNDPPKGQDMFSKAFENHGEGQTGSPSTSSRPSERGSSSRSDWGGGGGSGGRGSSSTSSSGVLGTIFGVIVMGAIAMGAISYFLSPRNSSPKTIPTLQTHGYIETQRYSITPNLDDSVRELLQTLKSTNQLMGNFDEYVLFSPRKVKRPYPYGEGSGGEYELAFVHPRGSRYAFSTKDAGRSWSAIPSGDEFFINLGNELIKEVRKNSGLSSEWIENAKKGIYPQEQNTQSGIYPQEPQRVLRKIPLSSSDWNITDLNPYEARHKWDLHWWLNDKLISNQEFKTTLESLASSIFEKTNRFETTIYEYSQIGPDIWVAGGIVGTDPIHGKYYTVPRGFICYSPDSGKTWIKQWSSEERRGDIVLGIYFKNTIEGFALTPYRILKTKDGGANWQQSFNSDIGLENLFIIDSKRLIASLRPPRHFYSSLDRGLSWTKQDFTPDYKRKMQDLEQIFVKQLHYGGVYSKEDLK